MSYVHIFYSEAVERAEKLGREWRESASCQGYTDLFFPVSAQGKPAPDYETPLALCRRCPVLEPCRLWATTAGEVKGGYAMNGQVLAGCAPKIRDRPGRPTIRPAPCGTYAAYKRHLRGGEEPCAECRAASVAYRRTRARAS